MTRGIAVLFGLALMGHAEPMDEAAEELSKQTEALQEPATNRVNLLRGILISNTDDSEKERAVKSLRISLC
jgi:hypothetical protein